MAQRSTHEFKDDKGEVVGEMLLDIISRDGATATVRWVIVDRNGRPLSGEDSTKVPHPTRGEMDADQLMPLVIAGIVKGRTPAGGTDVSSKKTAGKMPKGSSVVEELVHIEDDWELIRMIMRTMSSRSRSREDDENAKVIGLVRRLSGR